MSNGQWEQFKALNLTPDDFAPNELLQILSKLTMVVEIVTIVIYPFVSGIILTQSSSKLYFYRYLLLAQVTATTLLSTLMILFNPTILFPFTLAYLDGLVHCDYNMTKVAYLLIVGCVTNLATTTAVQLAYRIMITFPADHIFHRLCEPNRFIFIPLTMFTALTATFFIPVALDLPQGPELRASLLPDFPGLKDVFEHHPYVMGYLPDHDGPFNIAVHSYFIGSIILIPISIQLVLRLPYRLRKIKLSLQSYTYKVYVMLSRALLFQISLTITLLFPLCISATAALLLSWPAGRLFIQLLKLSVAIYSVCESLSLLYFILPYRNFITSTLHCRRSRVHVRVNRISSLT